MILKKYLSKIPYYFKIDVFLFVLLIGLGIKYVYNIENVLDIRLYDESGYLFHGIFLKHFGLPSAQLAPLYSLWYYILSLFQSDSINVYFTNYKIITIILPVLLFIVLRKYKIPRLPSSLIAYFFLLSFGNLMVGPKVSHFAIAIILISIFISTLFQRSYHRFAVIIIGSLLSSYIRPEIFITFLIFLVTYLYKIIKEKSFLKEIKITIILAVVITAHLVIFGIPITSGNRSFVAFSQHFSLNWVKWNNSQLSPWSNADEIINKNFGTVNSIYGAMISNEKMFFKHISTNIASFDNEFRNLFKHFTILFPDTYKFRKYELLLIIAIFLLFALYQIYVKNDKIIHYFKYNLKERKELFLICIIYMVPVSISIVAIYPRSHYLIIFWMMIILLWMLLLYSPKKENNEKGGFKFLYLIMLSAALIILTPNFSKLYSSPYQMNINIIKYLRSLNIKTKVNILDANGGHNIYVGLNYVKIPEYAKNTTFDKFLIQKDINMVMLTNKLLSFNRFKSDTSWIHFIDNYKVYGFSKEIVPKTGSVLLIKNNLIQ